MNKADCRTAKAKKAIKIKTIRSWSLDSLGDLCNKYGYYTQGTDEEYDKLMNYVITHRSTPENIYAVASNIVAHSAPEVCDSVELIMDEIENEAILTLYSVEEK